MRERVFDDGKRGRSMSCHKAVVRRLPIAAAALAFGWAFYCLLGPEVRVTIGDNGWPARVQFMHGPHAREAYVLNSLEVHSLFRADFNTLSEVGVNRYGEGGGMILTPNGLAEGDTAGRYESGDARDHLVTPYLSPQTGEAGIFLFSGWVRPSDGGPVPALWLQSENFTFLSQAQESVKRSDGWILLLGVAEKTGAGKVRLTLIQEPGTASLIDKMLLVEAKQQEY